MQNKLSKYVYFIVCFTFFLFLTLYISNFLTTQLLHGFTFSNDILSLHYIENRGAAFSILQDSRELLIILSIIALCLIYAYLIKNISKFSMITIFFSAMLTAGICGNLHERIAFGYVKDFIQFNFINFPIFNISDIFINISILVLIFILLSKKL